MCRHNATSTQCLGPTLNRGASVGYSVQAWGAPFYQLTTPSPLHTGRTGGQTVHCGPRPGQPGHWSEVGLYVALL